MVSVSSERKSTRDKTKSQKLAEWEKEPAREFRVTVVFKMQGENVGEFLEKVKKHPHYSYCFIEKVIMSRQLRSIDDGEEEG